MTTMEREAVAAVCVLASMADGAPSEPEQARLRESLEQLGGVDPAVFQRVVMRQTSLDEEARKINDPQLKRHAFTLAVGVCDSDGVSSQAEQQFLGRLGALLGLSEAEARQLTSEADDYARVALAPAAGAITSVPSAPAGTAAQASSQGDPAKAKQADDSILTYAAIAAALELMPQSLATVAVVPLQVKMVHKVGSVYGYSLDAGHIKEFIATIGAGLGGQFVESYARRFLGDLAGRYLGRTAKTIVTKATGPVMTFATTYAVGQVAKSYYASGRTLSMATLRQTFTGKVEEAKRLYTQHEPSIRQRAASLNPASVMGMLRGN